MEKEKSAYQKWRLSNMQRVKELAEKHKQKNNIAALACYYKNKEKIALEKMKKNGKKENKHIRLLLEMHGDYKKVGLAAKLPANTVYLCLYNLINITEETAMRFVAISNKQLKMSDFGFSDGILYKKQEQTMHWKDIVELQLSQDRKQINVSYKYLDKNLIQKTYLSPLRLSQGFYYHLLLS